MPPGNEAETWSSDTRGKDVRKTFRRRPISNLTFRRAGVPLIGFALLFAAIGLAFAYFTRSFSASGRLFAYEKTFASQAEAADFTASVTSTGSFAKVKAKLPRDISQEDFAERCQVTVDQGQPYVGVLVTAASASSARTLADVFTAHVAACADDWVSKRTKEVDKQISSAQRHLRDLRKQFGDFDDALLFADVRSLRQTLTKDTADRAAAVASVQSQLTAVNTEERKTIAALAADKPALRSLQQELEQALTRYTEEHPRVKELRSAIIALQKESMSQAAGQSSLSRTNVQLAELNSRRSALRAQLKKAEASELKSRQALQKFATNEVQFVRLQSEYNALSNRRDDLIQSRVLVGSKGVEKWRRSDRVELARVTNVPRLRNHAMAGAFAGLCIGSISYAVGRRRHRVIRDESALAEATGLPILASLPDLSLMTDAARQYWAVETLQLLRNTTGTARRGCFVCGIISATNGEGRSTWIDLLADAGLRNGHRVLIVSRPEDVDQRADAPADTLFLPQPVAETQSGSLARYALVGNVANITLQKNWERAFAAWQNEQNAVVLIELPSATTADALLLSSAVPNVLWLAAANVAEAQTTVSCVNSLRNTGCNLIGAALNMSSPTKTRAFAQAALLAALLACSSASAQQPQSPAPAVPATSAGAVATNALLLKSPPLAPWQQNLTLGSGDVFDIGLYGQPESLRTAVTIGPDGRFSYLQATDVLATGLTIDQLRLRMETNLARFHLMPRLVVVPVAFHSKRYYVLGNVQAPGAYPLNTPVTVLEAVARARGFVTAVQQRSTFTLADLSLAFLVRQQSDGSFSREPVDFEGLFQRGEIQHDKLLQPDDYLYFPPTGPAEVYVLGEVRTAGTLPYTKNLTTLGAIASRGGFTDGSYRQRILVVRGSLHNPETFVVNAADALRAARTDFVLKPKDIVYVSRKPWAKAEEILQAAASDFVRAVATAWAGGEIGVLIR